MTYQEILEGITRHRATPFDGSRDDISRKVGEIEWALQALAEKLRDEENPIERANEAIIAGMKKET